MKPEQIESFCDWWHTRKKKGIKVRGLNMSPATLNAYKRILRYIPDFEITQENFEQVRVMLIDYLRNWHKNTGKKFYPQVLNCLRSYLRFLEETNINIAPQIKYVRMNLNVGDLAVFQSTAYTQKYFIQKALTKEELRGLIKFAYAVGHYDNGGWLIDFSHLGELIQLAYDTGCRINELVSIEARHISTKDRAIVITGKGSYVRTVSWEPSTDPIIQKVMDRGRVTNWSKVTCQVYLKKLVRFYADETTKKLPSRLRKEQKERLNKISWHWFRHSKATHLAIVWKDVVRLTNYMGWSRIEMANTYVENSQKLLKMLHYKHTDLWLD